MTTPDASLPRVRIKVCGVTTVDDARMIAGTGVDWVGLNFHPPSPRFVSLEQAREITSALPPGVEPVGLFVDRPAEFVIECARLAGLQIVQLHGSEPIEVIDAVRRAGLRVVVARRLASIESVEAFLNEVRHFVERPEGNPVEAWLIDAYHPTVAGGTGLTVDPALLDRVAQAWEQGRGWPRLILAGGLNPETVGPAIARARPWMVDVASGVELAPGRKDPTLVARFVEAVHQVR